MKNRLCTILVIPVLLLLVSSTILGQNENKRKLPDHLNQVLDWLPSDTETLVVANGPFEIPAKVADDEEVGPFIESARSLACGLLGLQEGFLQERLQGQQVVFAVEANRRFTAPKGLGLMPYEGCQILQFDLSAQDRLESAVAACFEKAQQTVQLGGTKPAVFTERLEDDEWTFLVAQPRRGLLICATNQKFLEQVLERMSRVQPDRAFPDSLPEWRHVDVTAPVWAIRHYRRDFAGSDPSSPFMPRPAANVPDDKAVGFVFWFDAETKMANARYLTGAQDVHKIVTRT
jgi:hypothetical protein